MHVPYWSKKPYSGIFIVPHHDYALMVQAQLESKLEEQQKLLEECQGQLEEATSTNTQLWEALSQAGQDDAASLGDASGSGQQPPVPKSSSQSHSSGSGWGNKCVRLVKAVLDEHWGFAIKLATEYAEVPWVKRALESKKKREADGGDGPKASTSPWTGL